MPLPTPAPTLPHRIAVLAPLFVATACVGAGTTPTSTDDDLVARLADKVDDLDDQVDDLVTSNEALTARNDALAAEVTTLTTRLDATEAEAASLRQDLEAQVDALGALTETVTSLTSASGGSGGGTAELSALTARVRVLEARGTAAAASGSGTGTCAYLSTDVVAGRPVIVTATIRGYGNTGTSGAYLYHGGTVSATVSATLGGSGVGSTSLSASGGALGWSTYVSAVQWQASDTRTFTFTPATDGEIVVAMSASATAPDSRFTAPTVDACSVVAVQL